VHYWQVGYRQRTESTPVTLDLAPQKLASGIGGNQDHLVDKLHSLKPYSTSLFVAHVPSTFSTDAPRRIKETIILQLNN
jgi:hypothetical protein